MTDFYIGVDPGQNGGVSVLKGRELYVLRSMPPTEQEIWELFDSLPHGRVVLEKVHSRPGMSSRAVFTFGVNYGFIRACLVACEFPFVERIPQKWMSALSLRKRKDSETTSQWKNYLKSQGQQLYPKAHITLKTADALLISEYSRIINS